MERIDPPDLMESFFGCKEAQWSDPYWVANDAEKAALNEKCPVDNDKYFCRELSDHVVKTGRCMLYIAPFDHEDMWREVKVQWQDIDVRTRCLVCQGVFLFPVPPWMKSLVPPSVRPPSAAEMDAV